MRQNDRYQRQSFLGENSQLEIAGTHIGIVGLGGGGSHIAQQTAHIGFLRYSLVDPQAADEPNLNRTISMNHSDPARGTLKTEIAARKIRSLQPNAEILKIVDRWQDRADEIAICDVIFGCLDSFADRNEMETFCRRNLIVYIDIGMDVHRLPGESPRMAGQVILSAPGHSCMKCLRFITEERLAIEAQRYGDAGPRPQVVWPNGILASSAVGMAIEVISNWTRSDSAVRYLSYDGNTGTLIPHPRLLDLPSTCEHYPISASGEPTIVTL